MKTKLKDLEIEEGTICAKGKNPLAKIVLFKMDDVSKATKTEGGVEYPKSAYAYTPSDEPSTWKLRLVDSSGEMTAKQVGMAVAALGAGFRGNKVQIPEEDLPKVKAKVRAAWKKVNPDAEEVPAVLKSENMLSKMKNFAEGLLTSIEATYEDVTKAGKKISAANMEKLKAAMRVLHEMMGSMEGMEDMEPVEEGCKPKVKKSKGDDTVNYDEILKSLPEDQQKVMQAEIEKQAQEAVNKAIEDVKKSATPEMEAIQKKLEDMAKTNEVLAKALEVEKDQRITKEFEEVAKAYKDLPGVEVVAFGKLLKDLNQKAPEQYAELVKTLDASKEMISQNNILMKEIGGGQVPENDAGAQLEKLAKSIQKENPGMTYEIAYTKAMDENKQLYNEYLVEKRSN